LTAKRVTRMQAKTMTFIDVIKSVIKLMDLNCFYSYQQK
jgi:hypothetical protein